MSLYFGAGGAAPILYLQPAHDPLAHGHHAREYQALLGDRVTIVMIPQASHAAIAEQPAFISDALIAFAQQENISHVVFGQSARSRFDILLRGSVLNRFLSEVRDVTVQVVPMSKVKR